MKKLAIVVQRAGVNIIGGSEDYALRMARTLAHHYAVDILTTTAKDHNSWDNFFPRGVEKIVENLNVIRFPVDVGRTDLFHKLNHIIFFQFPVKRRAEEKTNNRTLLLRRIKNLPVGIQEEFILLQGPYSKALLEFLKQRQDDYDFFIFMTYLYAPTFFGIGLIDNRDKVFLCPTFHDEPLAYFPVFRKYLKYTLLLLTEGEKRSAEKIFGESPPHFHIIHFGLEDQYEKIPVNQDMRNPYIIYAGRLEGAKGIPLLFDYFMQFSRDNPHLNLQLFLLGDGPLKAIRHPKIKYCGVNEENQKLSLLKGATAFVHPSPFESLSIALIESFMVGTPAIVNKKSEVLCDHIEDSRAGFAYTSYQEFSSLLRQIVQDKNLKMALGRKARNYFNARYNIETYQKNLISIIEAGIQIASKKEKQIDD